MPLYPPAGPGAWITPTLLNSWAVSGSQAPRFRFNAGKVEFDGAAQTGTSGTVAFVLPVGFRHSTATGKFPLMLTSGGVGFITVAANGNVSLTQLTGSASTGSFMDDASFVVG